MSTYTVKSLLRKIDELYNGRKDGSWNEDDDLRTNEARQILEGVIDILRKNSDNTLA